MGMMYLPSLRWVLASYDFGTLKIASFTAKYCVPRYLFFGG